MNNVKYQYWFILTLLLGELSNLPMYIVYHLSKTKCEKSEKSIYSKWLKIETIHYSLIRIFGLGYCLFKAIDEIGFEY